MEDLIHIPRPDSTTNGIRTPSDSKTIPGLLRAGSVANSTMISLVGPTAWTLYLDPTTKAGSRLVDVSVRMFVNLSLGMFSRYLVGISLSPIKNPPHKKGELMWWVGLAPLWGKLGAVVSIVNTKI